MTPDECASIRSMARWVLPVLVGPSTAVTAVPRLRAPRGAGDENEIAISFPGWGAPASAAGPLSVPQCVTLRRRKGVWLNVANESGTNRARIADSEPDRVRSLRYVVPPGRQGTTWRLLPAASGWFRLQ